ncbi:hypothetical protein Q3G72_025223 [Acer saccharum]|nr:hypothetical protein Q3G72_025223 [Acer saccharum]
MTSIWKVSEGVEIEALVGNVFACHFKNLDDKKYIKAGGPWTFDRAITVFEEPSGTGDIAHMSFKTVEIWVQIHNLPLLCMTEDSGSYLGSMIGVVKDVDLQAAKNSGGKRGAIEGEEVVFLVAKKVKRGSIESANAPVTVAIEAEKAKCQYVQGREDNP